MRQRRKFSREFKVEAVRLSRQPGRSIGEVAKSLDIVEGSLRRWRDEFAADGDSALAGSGQIGLEEENCKPQAEVERLRMEREILKKRRSSSRGNRDEIQLHQGSLNDLASHNPVPCVGGVSQRVLRVASSAGE